MTDIS